jgi:hypothetical protein
MFSTKRFHAAFVLVCVGITGCTPANFIQRARPAPPCDVRICTTVGAGQANCRCQTHQQVQRQIRETWGHQVE